MHRIRLLAVVLSWALVAGIAAVAVATTPAAATESFACTRVAGSDRFATAARAATAAFPSGAKTALLANGAAVHFPDALAASYAAGFAQSPILLTDAESLPAPTLQALVTLEVTEVILVGGTDAISARVEEQLTQQGYEVTRVAGQTRYGTAAALASLPPDDFVGTDPSGATTAIVASGAAFPDALVGGVMAYASAFPVMLTDPTALSPQTRQSLLDLGIEHALILGGTGAVSAETENDIESLGITTERLAGSDRTETATEIASYEINELGYPNTAINLARGDDPADSLASVPVSGSTRTPLLLTLDPSTLGTFTGDFIAAYASTLAGCRIFGGTAAVSAAVASDATRRGTGGGGGPAGGPGTVPGGPGGGPGPDDPDDPPFAGEWIFEPQSLLLAPGDGPVEATLTFVDADGNRSTPDVPDGTTFQVMGDDTVGVTDDDGDHSFAVDPGDTVGSAALVASLPGRAERPVLYVTVARLRDEVVPITDDQVVHPAPNLPPGAEPDDPDGPGPFTWADLAAITDVPADDADPTADDVLQPDAQVAIVVRNPPPAVGELIVGVEGAPVLGRVVSVETSGDFSLLAVRLVPLGEIYEDLDFDPCDVPDDPNGAPQRCTTTPVEPTQLPPEAQGDGNPVAGFSAAERPTSSARAVQPDASAGRSAARSGPFPAAAAAPEPVPDANCEASLSGVMTDFKLINVTPSLRQEIMSAVQVDGGAVQRFFFKIIFDGSISAGVTGSVQAAIDLSVACTLVDVDTKDVPIPGPLAPFFTATVDPDIVAEGQLKFAGGPKIELGYSCTINVRLEVGFDYKQGQGVDALKQYEPPNPECAPVWKVLSGEAGDAGVVMSAEFNLGVALQFAFGGRIGGTATNVLAEFLGDEELGKVDLVTVKVGPRLHLVWENAAQVLVAEGAGSVVSVELIGSASAGVPPLEWLLQKLSGNEDLSLEITLFEGTLPLLGLYRSLVPGPSPSISVKVNGDEQLGAPGSVVEVTEGDGLELSITHSYGPILVPPPTDAAFSDRKGTAWVTDSGPTGYEELELFDGFAASGGAAAPRLTSSATITPGDCDDLRGDTPHTVAVLPEALLLGVAETQGWGGTFQIKCGDPEVRFATPEMRFEVTETDTPRTVRMTGVHTEEWSWELDPDGDFPDWLDITPASGTFADEDPAEQDLTVAIDCGELDEVVTHTVTTKAFRDGTDDEPTDTLDVTADCRDEFLEFRPDRITASGGSALTSFGDEPTTWSISGGGGSLEITPTSGNFAADELENTGISFRDTRRDPPPCEDDCGPPEPPPCSATPGEPGKPALPEEVVTVTVSSSTRGTAAIQVTLPERPAVEPTPPTPPPNPCPPPPPPPNPPSPACCGPGGGWGDPHMVSVDGLRYDAQVLGEYTYLAPVGHYAGPVLQGRHEYFSGRPGRGAPTSITGVAMRSGGHTVDLVSRPEFAIHIDGEPVDLGDNAPFAAGPELSIVRDGGRYRITTPAVVAVVAHRGHYFDLDVSTVGGRSELAGFLGRPNGDPGDDITTADGTTFTLDQVRGHTPEMYEFTDSWRLTDRRQSLFTNSYDGFHDQNIPFSSAALEPFRQQVRDTLGTIGHICSTAAGVSHIIEALAIELAAGRAIEEVDDYTCAYPVEGRAMVDGDPALGASGVQVSLDAPGLAPCVTTTDSDGRYRCIVSPDLTELQGMTGPPPLPLAIDVVASWPDGTPAASPARATFTAFAPLDRWASPAQVDLTVSLDTVPVLEATGAISGPDGEPLARPATVVAVARSATGEVGRYQIVVDGDDSSGRYRLTKVLPRSTKTVELLVTVASETQRRTFPIDGFGRIPVTFDVVVNPPVVNLSGTITGHDGAGLDGPLTAQIRSFDSDGSPVDTVELEIDPAEADGAYTAAVTLSPGAKRAVLTIQVGTFPSDWVVVEIDGITPGPRPETVDVVYDPPVLDLTGDIHRADGSPITDPVDIELRPTDADGAVLSPHVVTVDPGDDGTYSLDDHALPAAATGSELTFRIGPSPSGWVTTTVDDLVAGPNPRTVDVVVLGFGDVQVTLQWRDARDLDLHVTDPSGEHIFYSDPTSASGGRLDVDDTNGCPPDEGVENIFWPPGGAPPGDYTVEVHHYSSGGCSDTPSGGGNYTLTIRVAGQPDQVHDGFVGFGERDPYDFTVVGGAAH